MSTVENAALRAQIADAIPHLVWMHDGAGTPLYFNRCWIDYAGATLDDTLREGALSFVHPDDRDDVKTQSAGARASGEPYTIRYRLRRHDGAYRLHEARVVPLAGSGAGVTMWVGTATDIEDHDRVNEEQRFLAQATSVLGTSLDSKQTLADVAKMVVPRLADWCSIDLLQADGGLDRAAVAHVDPSKIALARKLHELQPPDPNAPHGVYAVMKSRTPELVNVTDEMLVAAISDPEVLALVRSLGLRSAITVPLMARDRVFGALALVTAETARIYGKHDVEFAQEVARRISIAIDNARLFEEATRARAAAEVIAADVLEQSKAVEAELLRMRSELERARAESRP